MEISLLFFIKCLFVGLGVVLFGWVGWLVNYRKVVELKLTNLSNKVSELEEQQKTIKEEVIIDLNKVTNSLVDSKLKPIQESLDLMTITTNMIRQDIKLLLDKLDK